MKSIDFSPLLTPFQTFLDANRNNNAPEMSDIRAHYAELQEKLLDTVSGKHLVAIDQLINQGIKNFHGESQVNDMTIIDITSVQYVERLKTLKKELSLMGLQVVLALQLGNHAMLQEGCSYFDTQPELEKKLQTLDQWLAELIENNFFSATQGRFEKCTMFHVAAYWGLTQTFELAIVRWRNLVNVVDVNGNTALHLIAQFPDNKMYEEAVKLIENGCDLRIRNHAGKHALELIPKDCLKKFYEMYQALKIKEKKNNDKLSLAFYREIKTPYVEKKLEILAHPISRLNFFGAVRKHKLYECILSSIFYSENKVELRNYLSEQFRLWEKNPVVFPLLGVWGLCVKFSHDSALKKLKKMRIIILKADPINNLVLMSDRVTGVYTNHNTLYVGGVTHNQILATLLHEMMHYVLLKVFDNNGQPFEVDDKNAEDRINAICENIKNKTQSNNMIVNGEENKVLALFKSVFVEGSCYEKKMLAQECMARIPDAICLVGYKKAYTFLKTHFADLIAYYEEAVLVKCMDYLKEKQFEHHFSENKSMLAQYQMDASKSSFLIQPSVKKTPAPFKFT